MYANTAGQKLTVVAFNNEDGPVEGDALNITCTIEKDDNGTTVQLTDTNPVQVGSGKDTTYEFDLTQEEVNGHKLQFSCESTTTGVFVVATPQVVYTVGPLSNETNPDLVLSQYGPKRMKTKQMEIEQFDPEKLNRLEERKATETPCFGSSTFCQGRGPFET